MSPGRLDILTEALTFVARLIMEARSDRDAESLRNQLRALGETKRANVGSVEAERLRELRQDEPTQTSPVGRFPQPVLDMGERPRIAPDFPGGPLGEGD